MDSRQRRCLGRQQAPWLQGGLCGDFQLKVQAMLRGAREMSAVCARASLWRHWTLLPLKWQHGWPCRLRWGQCPGRLAGTGQLLAVMPASLQPGLPLLATAASQVMREAAFGGAAMCHVELSGTLIHEQTSVLCYSAGVIMMLRELDRQAKLEGGRVIMLNGNHESLNVCGDFRWALVVLRPPVRWLRQ